MLDGAAISDLAHERASKYASKPAWDPVHAGILGAMAGGIPLGIFMGLANLRPDAFPIALVATVAICFLIPFGYLKQQQNTYYKAWNREYEAIRREHARDPKGELVGWVEQSETHHDESKY